jgi:hypothetical protein
MINDASAMGMRVYTSMTTAESIPFLEKIGFTFRCTRKAAPDWPTTYVMVREPEVLKKHKMGS